MFSFKGEHFFVYHNPGRIGEHGEENIGRSRSGQVETGGSGAMRKADCGTTLTLILSQWERGAEEIEALNCSGLA